MGKNKANKNQKKTAEFILTARPADDPDYNNPNVPQNVLLYVPKDKDDENTQKTLDNIPESMRGNTFDEETQAKLVRQKLGIEDNSEESNFNSSAFGAVKQNKEATKPKTKRDKVPVLFNEDANKDLTESEGEDRSGSENYDLEEDEEIIDTKINNNNNKKETGEERASNNKNKEDNNNNNKESKKPIGFKNTFKKDQHENLTLKDLLSGNKEKLLEIDDKTLDMLIKKSKAKIDAEVIHYNEYGLKNTLDPEILEYVTDKKFREGVDLFIPAPNYYEVLEQNRVDIDINPDEMNADYKEVYEALNKEESDEEADEGVLEDDFILLANDGRLPIELLEEEALNGKDEILLVETNNKKDPKQPSYKFITKEEKEFLDKQFSKTYEQFYKEEESNEAHDGLKAVKNANKFAAVEEEEFEEYELSDAEMSAKNKKSKKTDLKSKEFNDAINELLPKHKRISNENNESEEEEEFEENEEEEFEEFDDNLLDDEYIRKQQELGDMESTFKYSENLVLQEKGARKADAGNERKLVEKKNLVLKTKKKLEDEETIEDMENYLYSKEVIEMDLKVINDMLLRDEKNKEADQAKEETDPAYDLNYAKKYLDITSVGGTFGNMPKTIAIEGDPKKLEKKLKREEKLKKEKEGKLATKSEEAKRPNNNSKGIVNSKIDILSEINVNKNKKAEFDFKKEIKVANSLNINSQQKKDLASDDFGKEFEKKLEHLVDSDIEEDKSDRDEEDVNFNELEEKHKFENLNEKEANKLRKKMLKNEKKEKRKLKKEIKLAFKDEKVKQSKQIANTNTVIRYGMSVKEI